MPDLSFFNAFSNNASIHNDGHIIRNSSHNPQDKIRIPVLDQNLNEHIESLCADKNQNSITRAWSLLTGVHYIYTPLINGSYLGAKGLLDLLVFPLMSRALYQSVVDHPDHKDMFYSTFARFIWAALEVARLALAIVLLLPTAAIMCMMPEAKPLEFHLDDPDKHFILGN